MASTPYSAMNYRKTKRNFIVSFPGAMNTSDHLSTVVKFVDCQLCLFACSGGCFACKYKQYILTKTLGYPEDDRKTVGCLTPHNGRGKKGRGTTNRQKPKPHYPVRPGGNPEKSTWSWMGRPLIEYDIRMRSRTLACTRGKKRKELVSPIHLFKCGIVEAKKSARAWGGETSLYTHADWRSDAHLLCLCCPGVDVRT